MLGIKPVFPELMIMLSGYNFLIDLIQSCSREITINRYKGNSYKKAIAFPIIVVREKDRN